MSRVIARARVIPARASVRQIGSSLTLLLTLLSTGCAFAPGMNVEIDEGPKTSQEYRVVPVNAELIRDQRVTRDRRLSNLQANGLPSFDAAKMERDYRVGAGDILTIAVWGNPELSNESDERRTPQSGVVVGPDGRIFFPYAGLVPVIGMTVEQIRSAITQKLAVFMREPQVDVRMAQFRSQRVQVTGEVVQPGTVPLDNTSKGVLEALNERGGMSERASRRRVYLSRDGKRYEVDLDRLYGGEFGSFSPVLQSGDVIRVPDASEDQIVVLGAVEAPKSVPMIGDSLSAISAIAAAGGVSRTSARGSDIYVFRAAATGPPEAGPIQVFQIDMSQPQGLLFATHFILNPRDVVYVAATELSRFNSVGQQLLPTLQDIFYVDRLTGGN